MLKKLAFDDEKVVAFSWSGKFTEDAFHQAMSQFLPELANRAEFNIYIELLSMDGADAAAVWKDLKFYLKNASEVMKKIEKIALVTDETWIKNMAIASYAFIPGIDLKTFTFSEKAEAKVWVTE